MDHDENRTTNKLCTSREKINVVFLRSIIWVLRFLILYLISKTLIESRINDRIPEAGKLLINLYTNGFIIYYSLIIVLDFIETLSTHYTQKIYMLALILCLLILVI
jgi:hypothetical protein